LGKEITGEAQAFRMVIKVLMYKCATQQCSMLIQAPG